MVQNSWYKFPNLLTGDFVSKQPLLVLQWICLRIYQPKFLEENDKKDKPEITNNKETPFLQQQVLIKQMLEIEQKRIESLDQKTKVAELFIIKNDEADQRQYDFQIKRLKNQDSANKRNHNLAKGMLIGGGLFTALFISTLLYFVFTGDTIQSSNALEFLKIIGTGLAGYGVFSAIISAIRKFF